MSFTTQIKEEIIKNEFNNLEIISLLSAFFRQNAYIDEKQIRVHTENIDVCRFLFSKIEELYKFRPRIVLRKNFNFRKNYLYILEIEKNKDEILKNLALINQDGYFTNLPKEFIYADDELKNSYLKGTFLASGSINDPKKSRYHLEFLLDDEEYAIFVDDLLNNFSLNSRIINRVKGYMVYIKEAEKISDFLKIIKAFQAVLYFEDVRIYRDQKNKTNRLNNCEQANVEKIINSSNQQIEDINLIAEKMGLDLLEEKLQEVAMYRLKYQESSLLELSEIISFESSKKISKSCLNHRLRKIKEIANRLKITKSS